MGNCPGHFDADVGSSLRTAALQLCGPAPFALEWTTTNPLKHKVAGGPGNLNFNKELSWSDARVK